MPDVPVFQREVTQSQLLRLYQSGLEAKEAYWNLGYPKLTAAFPALQAGLAFLISPENVGKSQFLVNLGTNVLLHNPDAYWLDFSLDDSVETRLAYLMARFGGIPINLSRQTGEATDDVLAERRRAFQRFNQEHGARYRLFGISTLGEDGEMIYSVEGITDVIARARAELGDGARLFVTIDGFHDVDLDSRAEDENARLARKSLVFKRTATRENALLFLTAHTRKDSRRRGISADCLKGEGRIVYDATLVLHLYSDVNANRGEAVVYWIDEAQPDRLMPILELDILKNKCGVAKEVLFYPAVPEQCLLSEAGDEEQALYRSYLYGLRKKK